MPYLSLLWSWLYSFPTSTKVTARKIKYHEDFYWDQLSGKEYKLVHWPPDVTAKQPKELVWIIDDNANAYCIFEAQHELNRETRRCFAKRMK